MCNYRIQHRHTTTTTTTLSFLSALVLCFVYFLFIPALTPQVNAAPNYEINYQGKLTNASNVTVADGTYNMRFWLLTSPSIATTSAVWTEELIGGDVVQVTDGLFSVMLGSTSPLSGVDFNQTLYLGVEIGGTGGSPSWDGEMSPRKVLGAVPAAFEAENAQTLDNLATTSLLRSDADDTATGLLTFTGGIISTASSTITNLTTLIATTTTLVINGDQFTDLMGSGLTISSGALTCATATSAVFGCLTTTDWTSFNAKVSSTSIDTSAELAALLTDETGTGNVVFSESPTFTGTPTFANLYVTPTGTTTLGYASTTALTVGGNLFVSGTSTLATTSVTDLTVTGNLTTVGVNWTARSATGDNDNWNSITYGNGLFVAVSQSGERVITSPDGINWTARSAAGDDDTWYGVTYGNGLFVAVSGSSDPVMTSPDGITWTARSAAGNNDLWQSVTYGNGLFVAVSQSGDRVITSPDGITWTARSAAGGDDDWRSVTYGNGLFVAVSQSGDPVMTSPDGINWTARSAAGDDDVWYSVTYGNGLFVAVGTSTGTDRVMTSPDGITWTARSATGDNDDWRSVTYGNGLFVAVSGSGDRVMTSPDGINWTARSATGDNDDWRSVTYGNGLFVAVSQSGDRIMTSGKTFTNALATNNLFQGGMSILGGTLNIGTTTPTTSPLYGLNVLNIASTTGTALFTITNSGNVGIGTTSPTRMLTVTGDIHSTNNITAASSTITYASTTALTVSGNSYFNFASLSYASTTGFTAQNAYVGNTLGIGTTTPISLLTMGTTSVSGARVAGLKQYFGFTNSVESAVYYGDETYIVNAPTATSTLVGKMIRIEDTSTLGNTVRGFEAQAYRGTNTKGENTGLSGFGRTFGVRGTTIGDAGDTFLPAGVFAQSQGTTQGNALRAYSGTLTTETLVSLFHDTSIFSGTGLEMSFGNSGGSFAATSTAKFLDFQVAGVSKFIVSANGSTTIGDGTVNASLMIPYGGICVDNDGSCISTTTGQIRSVTSVLGNSDLAEIYFSGQSLQTGEIVSLSGGLSVKRAENATEKNIVGVVSTKPGMTLGFDDSSLISGEHGYPIGLKGRVPVKLSTENGPIKKGDRITLSSTPGVGMKATESSRIVGIALEDYDGGRAYSEGFLNQFGDDMVKEDVTAQKTETDVRTQDGCYYGGGSALGEEACKAVDIVASIPATTLEATHEEALRVLKNKPAQQVTTEAGEDAYVGQAIMFIELGWYQSDVERSVLVELTATSTLQDTDETLWDKLKLLAQNFVDGVLSVFELKANRVEVSEELCVDGVCVSADDLQALLQSVRGGTTSAPDTPPSDGTGGDSDGGTSVGDTGTSTPDADDESATSTLPIDETPEPSSEEEGSGVEDDPVVEESPAGEEVVPEPESEPEPEPTPEPAPTSEVTTSEPSV